MRDDDVRAAVQELRQELKAAQEGLKATQEGLKATQEGLKATQEGLASADRRFSNFVGRFDEVAEMLIEHDTGQLRRVAAVERENAELRQKVEEAFRRIDALEKRAS
ncbi:MAG: hypothetical protein HY319_09890 [Armatimonadetes bacterium]|nr:hypothetical protein [Armatimonadota bacterium]